MVVVKSKTKKALNAFNVAEDPIGTKWTYQTKGWMEESLGVIWFQLVFIPHIGERRP
ncbi:hypothetical protein DPMN_023422 [Dreissena polymorpha]|uniref:DDE-1 domain-containing protein n=1 Tax=Dreissena polymorpha TaxID=45954 RepID=A0A9D4R9W8_DREPO|nr:hypothetical protein DPMN_023422 [Dreissena polymorpha]